MSEMRVVAVDTLTGVPFVQDVPVSAVSWTRTMGGSGDGTFTIDTERLTSAEVRRLARGWATTLVADYLSGSPLAGTPEYAGLVQAVPDWDGNYLTLATKELPVMLSKRQLFGVQPGPVTRTYRGAALADVIIQFFRTVFLDGSTRWNLPISTGPWDPSGDVVRTVDWWRFLPAVDGLKALTDEVGAPLWDLRPYWSSGKLAWRLYVGNLEGGVVDMPVSTPAVPVKSGAQVGVARDWQAQKTGVIAVGTGQEDAIRWAGAGVNDMPVADETPWLDSTVSWIQVEDVGELKQLARGELEQQRYGVDQWKVAVQCDEQLSPTLLRPGTEARMLHPGDKLLDPGMYRRRVLSVAGDQSMKRTLTVQEVR